MFRTITNRVLKFPFQLRFDYIWDHSGWDRYGGSALNQLIIPRGIYVDESDNDTLYIADCNNNRVMKWLVNATNGTIVAGGNGAGAATRKCIVHLMFSLTPLERSTLVNIPI